MKRLVIVSGLAVALSGCGGASFLQTPSETELNSGAGGYTYEKKVTRQDGTVEELKITAQSARDITGASISISENNAMTADVKKTEGGAYSAEAINNIATKALDVVDRAIPDLNGPTQ